MAKEITVVYPPHESERVIHYQGPEGTVWLDRQRNTTMPNVFIGWDACPHPNPEDSLYMLEPIVVRNQDYNVQYLSRFKKVFGCFDKCFENTIIKDKYVSVNYGSTLGPEDADVLRSKWLPWEERIDGVVVVSSSKTSTDPQSIYHLRENIADLFHDSGYKVAWFGGIPFGRRKPYYNGALKDKIAEIAKYKFHVCTENTYDPIYSHNYLTEKLPHAIEGGAVPLYMGCYNVESLVPERGYFDLRPFVENKTIKAKEFLEAIKSYSKQDFETYNQIAYDFMKDPNGLFYHTDMRRAYKKMLEVL
jgi:hypothetical protein